MAADSHDTRAGLDQLGARLTQLLEIYGEQGDLLSVPDSVLIAGIKRWYSAAEAARFFNRTSAWIYERLSKKKFTYEDGTPIVPRMVGEGPKPRMRFDRDLILEIACSMYRDGTVKINELQVIVARVNAAESDGVIPDLEDA